jgi:hypothetical protein
MTTMPAIQDALPPTSDPAVRSTVLLACPFCGKTPIASHGKVRCKNQDCKIQPSTFAWFVKTADAIQEWNAVMANSEVSSGAKTP